MTVTTTPTWSTPAALIATQTIARNATPVRATIDLREKFGAFLFANLGRGGTTAITTHPVYVRVRRMATTTAIIPGATVAEFGSLMAAAVSTTCAASGNDVGVTSLAVASTTSFAVGDIICISEAAPGAATEWAKVAEIIDSTHLGIDAPTQFAHNDTGHTVRNKADSWQVRLEGGAQYEVIVDYGGSGAGESITAQVLAQTFDSLSNA